MISEEIYQTLQQAGSPKILVIGDLMLDRYSWGTVDRISPEAPIPILRVTSENIRLGGAGNVATNLAMLGAQVNVCGIVGQDEAAQSVYELMSEMNIDASPVFQSETYTTIVKHRMIATDHHLLRMDYDPPKSWNQLPEERIYSSLQEAISHTQLVILSDYGKGLLTEFLLKKILGLTKKFKIPVVVDPRYGVNIEIYQGSTLIKPNRKETETAVGFSLDHPDRILQAAAQLQQQAHCKCIALSLDKEGLLLFESPEKYTFLEAQTQKVYDVVGAGDMVVSVLSYLLAEQSSLEVAGFWANLAASMQVQHVGVVSFTKNELLQRFEFGEHSHKIISLSQLLKKLPNSEKPIVFTNGYFDNLSSGHLKFLQQLQNYQGTHIVAINSDLSIEQQKGKQPLLNEKERALLLASIESVDWIILFDEEDTNQLLSKIQPDILVKGEHYKTTPMREQNTIDQLGIHIEFLTEY